MIRVPGRGVAVLTFLSGLGLAVLLVAPAPPAAARNQVQKYAVLLDAEAEPDRYAAYFAERLGITVRHVFQHALNGFAADLTPAQADLLRQERVVTSVDPDGVAQVRDRRADGGGGAVLLEELAPLATRPTRQTVPIGVARVGATRSATAGINGRDDAFPVDIAVLDTGVDASHPDLNVAGSVSTVGGTTGDVHGHGTHIAGVIGARDNRTGVVGVAPGARLWSVRALDASGVGAYTDMAAGVDWVTARANTIK
ncbi:MAG: hypothetical protein FJX77_16610, partial [Armatimonadetes bacterium]|nr:hypothetical protein [Armatimonadota bacterium]